MKLVDAALVTYQSCYLNIANTIHHIHICRTHTKTLPLAQVDINLYHFNRVRISQVTTDIWVRV